MPAYAIAHLREAALVPEIVKYVERIGATFEPHGGRFLVHAAQHEVKEGSWPGNVVVIGFPGIAEARAWWDSPRTRRSRPCAHGTSRATSSWSRASPTATTPLPPPRRCGRPCPTSSRRSEPGAADSRRGGRRHRWGHRGASARTGGSPVRLDGGRVRDGLEWDIVSVSPAEPASSSSPVSLCAREPRVAAERLVAEMVPPPRFDSVRFATYVPDPEQPSQTEAVTVLSAFAAGLVGDNDREGKRRWFGRSGRTEPAAPVVSTSTAVTASARRISSPPSGTRPPPNRNRRRSAPSSS